MDIDKFVHKPCFHKRVFSFGSLMDIDKFVLQTGSTRGFASFGSLMDIDKFVLISSRVSFISVSVL